MRFHTGAGRNRLPDGIEFVRPFGPTRIGSILMLARGLTDSYQGTTSVVSPETFQTLGIPLARPDFVNAVRTKGIAADAIHSGL